MLFLIQMTILVWNLNPPLNPPTPKKAKPSKFKGAAKYKTKFNPDWKKEFPFITSVAGDLYRLHLASFIYLNYRKQFTHITS